MSEQETVSSGFRIFRGDDSPSLADAGCMSVVPFTEKQRAGLDLLRDAGNLEGDEVKVLCSLPGFSLTYAWFKTGFALPLHSHDADCLYYIVAGSLRLGTEDLGARDSFFVPANVPYTYKPGPDGVEVLEFRHETQFNFLNHANSESFYRKAAETVREASVGWADAVRPSQVTSRKNSSGSA